MILNLIPSKHLSFILMSSILLFLSHTAQAAITWQTLAPGIEYTMLDKSTSLLSSHIHAFKIDLKQNQLDLALATDNHLPVATVQTLAEKNNAFIAINGGFFTPELHPIGLRIKQGTIKSAMKNTSWWGIFYISHNTAKIAAQRDFKYLPDIDFAIQSGPRLIAHGLIASHLKPGIYQRTSLGINHQGQVILLVTDHAALDTLSLAAIMQAPETQNGFDCEDALNLDGGSSSQLYAKIGDFTLHIPGRTSITDSVIVIPQIKNDRLIEH